jgi:aspartyl-tRNA(Asn)/glutamyl-tRNA(Gln) amidotransferase subunit A
MSAQAWTIAEARRFIDAGKLSPVELTRACLARIEAVDRQLNAFVLVRGDEALGEARTAEAEIAARRRRGPLHGIPIGLKDIIETAGIRTTGHSRVRLDHVPRVDAAVARRLREAGVVLLGKLATHEFAFGGPSFDLPFPPARNPWNLDCIPGGSSSGSAAAVAAGLCLGALGTDTGGSVRGPAALCGIAGLKPTYGLVPRTGIFPLAFSLDHCGPMTWTVEDCAIMLGVIAGHDPSDPTSRTGSVPDYTKALTGELRGLRIGALRHFWAEDGPPPHAEQVLAMDTAIGVLRELGATVEDVQLSSLRDYHAVALLIMLAEGFAVHQRDLLTRPHEFGEIFRHRMLAGAFVSAPDYVQATRLRRRLALEMDAALTRQDALLSAGAFAPAPRFDQVGKFSLFEQPNLTTPANVTGLPALAVCCGFTADGLPLSLQLIGRRGDEATVLRAGHAYEQATPWRDRRPPL